MQPHICNRPALSISPSRATERRLETGLCEKERKRNGLGDCSRRIVRRCFEFIVPRMTEGLGFSEGEVGEFVRESLERSRAEDGLEWVMYVTVGRKPGA